jgi:phage/plasmid-like protein (TIGR03299 family)
MSAELDQNSDGSANIVYNSQRGVPWHQLGTPSDGLMTAAEALQKSGLDNDVEKTPVFMEVNGEKIEVPDRFATWQPHPETGRPRVLGVVGGSYRVIQNKKLFSTLDDLVDSGEAKYDTAGQLRDGKVVFVTMVLPEGVMIGGRDRHDLYLNASTSHDGSMRCSTRIDPVRQVCMNTVRLSLASAVHDFSVYHTENAEVNIAQMREELRLTFAYVDEFKRIGDRLADQEFTDSQFERLIDELYGPTGKPETITENQRLRHDERKARFFDVFKIADTQANIRGTAWAGLQTVIEIEDWLQPLKPTRGQTPAMARAERTLSSAKAQEKKDRAFKIITRMVNAGK